MASVTGKIQCFKEVNPTVVGLSDSPILVRGWGAKSPQLTLDW